VDVASLRVRDDRLNRFRGQRVLFHRLENRLVHLPQRHPQRVRAGALAPPTMADVVGVSPFRLLLCSMIHLRSGRFGSGFSEQLCERVAGESGCRSERGDAQRSNRCISARDVGGRALNSVGPLEA
jgi:hypothetical protein